MSRTQLNKRASEKLAEIFSTAMLNHKDKSELSGEEKKFLQWHKECEEKAIEYVLNMPNKNGKFSYVNLVGKGIDYYKSLVVERCNTEENQPD